MAQSEILTAAFSLRARPGPRVKAALAGAGAVTVVVLFAAGLVLYVLNGGAEAPNGRDYTLGILIASLSFGLPGAVLVRRSTVPAIGLVSLAAGISLGLDAALTGWALRGLQVTGSLPGSKLALWMSVWCWTPGYGLVATVLLLLLPDGRLAPLWRRRVAWISVFAIGAVTAGMAVGPYSVSDLPRAYAGHSNPVLAHGLSDVLDAIGLLLIPCAVASLLSLISRFRQSASDEREQLKWIAFGGALTIVLFAGAFAAGSHGDVLFAAAMVPLPAAMTIAVLRYGLWDVDLVINRSLVYLILSAVSIIVYVGGIALISGAVGGIVAVAIIAVGLHPMHRRVQDAVNRLFYGERDDPAATLRRLGDRLALAVGAEEVLPTAAETVARALRLPYVGVSLPEGGGGHYGEPPKDAIALELRYQGAPVGELLVAPRDPGGRLSRADMRSLETISRQLGVAVHAVQLSRELQRSRERIVVAREEERRRLRRELHDGLGPTLAALALELEAARELIDTAPQRVDETLERAASRATDTVADVRRIVHDLRPPALDDLGLVQAIREQADRLSAGGVRLSVRAPADLPPLPAAVEAAAYRIVSEALANVVRHAAAHTGSVEVSFDGSALVISVTDDGCGIATSAPPGVGLSSMRERAEELRGAFEVHAAPGGGTQIVARLPVAAR